MSLFCYSPAAQFFNALYEKNMDKLSGLLNECPNFSTTYICQVTPLYIATSTTTIDLAFITLLLENGAHIHINVPSFETGRTPIDNLDFYNVCNKDEILEMFYSY